MSELNTALLFIATQATDEDLNRLFDAGNARRKVLRAQRSAEITATITSGTKVTLSGLSPKALNGLTGTVKDVRGDAVDVLIDEASTETLSWSRTKFAGPARHFAAQGEGYPLNGIPASCIRIEA